MAAEIVPAELTAAERRALAATLIRAAGDLVATAQHGGEPPEVATELPKGMDPDAAARQLGRWLAKLPGAAMGWDELLTWPTGSPR